jgi:NAD-dependent deacetylase
LPSPPVRVKSSPMVDTTALERAAEALDRARLVAISSGAGISKESGVPTFRDAQDGLWAKYDPEQLATPTAFMRDPDLVWSWYMYRHSLVQNAVPNPGHYAIAALEELVPEVVVLTQNVDGMHARAGSTDIVELHGRLGRFKCFENCQGVPTYIDMTTIVHDAEHAPPCPHCSSRLRPDVVWFGEALPRDGLERAFEVAQLCDVMLVVGTSGMVQPAASLPQVARNIGATVIEVNPEPSMITPDVHFFLQGKSGEVLPALVAAVQELRAHQ